MLFTKTDKVKLGYVGTIEGNGMYENIRMNPQPIIDLYKGVEPNTKREASFNREFFKVKDNKDEIASYYFFARANGVDMFVELPLVTDDNTFQWIRRDWGSQGHVKTLWTQIKSGQLTFNCAYYLDNKNTHVNINWNGNRLDCFWVDGGTNEDILAAIEEWKGLFQAEVTRSVA